jgi:hypothetical protein
MLVTIDYRCAKKDREGFIHLSDQFYNVAFQMRENTQYIQQAVL